MNDDTEKDFNPVMDWGHRDLKTIGWLNLLGATKREGNYSLDLRITVGGEVIPNKRLFEYLEKWVNYEAGKLVEDRLNGQMNGLYDKFEEFQKEVTGRLSSFHFKLPAKVDLEEENKALQEKVKKLEGQVSALESWIPQHLTEEEKEWLRAVRAGEELWKKGF